MVRTTLKSGVAGFLGWSGAAAAYRRLAGIDAVPLVIGYHRVVEDFDAAAATSIPAMLVSTKTLAMHIEWLASRYELVGLDEVTDAARARRSSRPLAALTFDDAYADVYYNAFPLLKSKGIPFALFAATDLIGSRQLYVHDELYCLASALLAEGGAGAVRLREALTESGAEELFRDGGGSLDDPFRFVRGALETLPRKILDRLLASLRRDAEVPPEVASDMLCADWAMLHEMHDCGAVIGCHSRSHPLLTNETGDTLVEEIAGARWALEYGLDAAVAHFAYPDGAFNRSVVEAVGAAGFEYAYGTCAHRDPTAPQLTIPRRLFWERSSLNLSGEFSPSVMNCQVSGLLDFSDRCGGRHG